MTGRCGLFLASLTLMLLHCSTACAQVTTEQGLSLFLNGRFPDAIHTFEEVLDGPELTVPEAVESHRYLVVLYDLTGDAARARSHAAAAVALDAQVMAPDGASRTAERLLEEARATALPGTVVVESVGSERAGQEVTIRSRVDHGDALDLAGITMHCSFGEEEADAEGEVSGTQLVQANARSPVRCDALALTAGGAPLLAGNLELSLLEGEAAQDAHEGSARRRWFILGGSAAAVALLAVVLAVALPRSQDPRLGRTEPTFADSSMP